MAAYSDVVAAKSKGNVIFSEERMHFQVIKLEILEGFCEKLTDLKE